MRVTADHQLGLKKTGYEIGIHSARHLAKMSRLSGLVILLIDFENAFNKVDRALLLELVIALVPEAASVFWWLYERETILMTRRGDEITCSTGVMQGCSFASIAFALVIKWLVAQMKHRGLERKQFFMDDGLLYGTPMAVKWSVDLIEKLEHISGLKLKLVKMSVHAPNSGSAELCRQLLPKNITVVEDEEMNLVYLKTPIGTEKFVESYLEEKLDRLCKDINLLSEMTHLHECFTLLRSCSSACKVTHLMRTVPPLKLTKFLNSFDSQLRKAMERILGHDLKDHQWLTCQLPGKFGGFGLRSGTLTSGAQYVMSLQKCAKDMDSHTDGWDLRDCAKETSESWLKECIGMDFDVDDYLSESKNEQPPKSNSRLGIKSYSMSLAQ